MFLSLWSVIHTGMIRKARADLPGKIKLVKFFHVAVSEGLRPPSEGILLWRLVSGCFRVCHPGVTSPASQDKGRPHG